MCAVKRYFNRYEDELTVASEAFYAWKKFITSLNTINLFIQC
jgi:hypothetical protein